MDRGGYVCYPRETMKKLMGRPDQSFKVFSWMLATAHWEKGVYKGVDLEPGQGLFSLRNMAEELSITKKQAEDAVNFLKKGGHLRGQNRGRLASVFTIEKYKENFTISTERGQSRGQNRGNIGDRRVTQGGQEEELKHLRQDLKPPAAEAAPVKGHQQVIDAYHQAYTSTQGLKPDLRPADFKAVKDALARGLSPEELVAQIPSLFTWPAKFTAGHSLKHFCDNWQKFKEPYAQNGGRNPSRVERGTGVMPGAWDEPHL